MVPCDVLLAGNSEIIETPDVQKRSEERVVFEQCNQLLNFPENTKKLGSCQGDVLTCTDWALRQSTNNNLLELFLSLQAIHSVNVCLVLLLDGFPFELEGSRNEARF